MSASTPGQKAESDFRQGVQLTLTMAMTLATKDPKLTGPELALALREMLEETVFERGMSDLMWKPLHFRDVPEPEPAAHYPPFARGGMVTLPTTASVPPPYPRSNSAKDTADWLEAWLHPGAPGGTEKRLVTTIYRELASSRMINAIKEYRATMGVGLKESKEGVTEFRDRLVRSGSLPTPAPLPPYHSTPWSSKP